MFVRVDVGTFPPVLTLEEPDDCTRFFVEVVGGRDPGLVFGAMVDAAAGRLEGEDALVTVDSVRRLAAGRVGADWDERFTAMLDDARAEGRVDATNNAIRARVEHRDAD